MAKTNWSGIRQQSAYLMVVVTLGCFIFALTPEKGCSVPSPGGMGLSLLQENRQEIKDKLFKKVEALIEQAKEKQADLLSPNVYARAIKKHEEALSNFEKGKDLNTITKNLNEAETLLGTALKNAELTRVTLPELLSARENALEANAPEFALELYEEAERTMAEAVRKIEIGDLNEAKKKSQQAEQKFRDSELKAIKVSIIGNVHNLMEQARKAEAEKYAPRTYLNATTLLNEAEKILTSDPKAQSTAREKAEEAEYQARHALYLTELVKQNKDDVKSWEKLILEQEALVAEVLAEIGFQARFDEGLVKPINSIQLALRNLKEENKSLSNELSQQNFKINNLSLELSSLQKELSTVREKEAGLKGKLEAEQRKAEKMKWVEELFSVNEATVLRKGNSLIIRLKGLSFPVGKAIIDPQYFSLLSKVQRAIREFPECPITIEGHTDSKGDDRYNERLSLERAIAVKQYLQANMNLTDEQIRAIGYGESRPIASNETEEGRAQNRRIDVVISLEGSEAVSGW